MTPRTSPLDAAHRALGAKMVPFGGWDMPLSYASGTIAEHTACRNDAVAFDVSHLGTVRVEGPGALDRLQAALTNDLGKVGPGRAQYTHLLDEADASVLDDIIVWWQAEDVFDVMPNASNTERVVAALGGEDVTATRAIIAVQGPQARERLATIAPEAAAIGRFRVGTAPVAGAECTVAGTGYTGEDGVEILIPPDGATAVWDALMEQGVTPAGLGARDTLRLEVCFHLYGNDLSEDRNPIEAGLAWCCKLDTGFIGSDALRGLEPEQTLVPFAFTGPGIPRQGNPVHTARGEGVVTSGTLSPCLEVGIGMGYVPVADESPGTKLSVDVRGKPREAEVREKPLYRKETSG